MKGRKEFSPKEVTVESLMAQLDQREITYQEFSSKVGALKNPQLNTAGAGKDKNTLLHLAVLEYAKSGNLIAYQDAMKFLARDKDKNQLVTLMNAKKETPLKALLSMEDSKHKVHMTLLLLNNGAEPATRDKSGLTAVQYLLTQTQTSEYDGPIKEYIYNRADKSRSKDKVMDTKPLTQYVLNRLDEGNFDKLNPRARMLVNLYGNNTLRNEKGQNLQQLEEAFKKPTKQMPVAKQPEINPVAKQSETNIDNSTNSHSVSMEKVEPTPTSQVVIPSPVHEVREPETQIVSQSTAPENLPVDEALQKLNRELDEKIDAFKKAVQNMHNYGITLFEKGDAKGARVCVMAKKLTNLSSAFRQDKDYPKFEKDVKAIFANKAYKLDDYRFAWKTVVANVLIALTGIGAVVMAGQLLYSKATQGRALFFFQQPKTTSEGLAEKAKDAFNEIKPSGK